MYPTSETSWSGLAESVDPTVTGLPLLCRAAGVAVLGSCHISTRRAGYSSPWRLAVSRSRSTLGSMTKSGGGGDRRVPHRDRHEPMVAGGAALRSHRAGSASVNASASAFRGACGTPPHRHRSFRNSYDRNCACRHGHAVGRLLGFEDGACARGSTARGALRDAQMLYLVKMLRLGNQM